MKHSKYSDRNPSSISPLIKLDATFRKPHWRVPATDANGDPWMECAKALYIMMRNDQDEPPAFGYHQVSNYNRLVLKGIPSHEALIDTLHGWSGSGSKFAKELLAKNERRSVKTIISKGGMPAETVFRMYEAVG